MPLTPLNLFDNIEIKLRMRKVTVSESILVTVRQEAEKIDQYMHADLNLLKADMDALLFEVLDYGLFNGGKRLRPLLVVLAARLCGNINDNAYRLGIAFEYLHAATLFHDDIIDKSSTRRGKQSVHHKFGTISAILAGDFLHAHAMATVGKLAGLEGLEAFCKATTGMVDGEFMQLRNAERHNLSELDYYNAIMGKTGLLIAAACEVGAVYGGGNEMSIKALREYGVHLGCAFQIIDDLLDYQGNPSETGKTVGNDLAEGKMTLPLILALSKADERDKDQLMAILRDSEKRASCITEVTSIIDKYSGFDDARKRAEDAVEQASTILEGFNGQQVSSARNVLEGLARYVLVRRK